LSQRSFKRAHARRIAKERRRAATLRRRGGIIAGVLGATTLFAASAQAATYTVSTTNDDAPGGTCTATCTLRDALTAANADTSADTITFAGGLTGTITLTNGPLPISGSGGLTITGPGSGDLTVSGDDSSQIFDITTPDTSSVSITGLTLTDGSVTGDSGGAIVVGDDAALTLSGDTISDSTTNVDGGGIFSDGPITVSNSVISGNTSSDDDGGGIEEDSDDSVTITGSTITGNSAEEGGGIAGGDEDISGTTITGNHATSNDGGGLDTDDGLSLQGSTVSGNSAVDSGGGIFVDGKYGDTISGSKISGNTAAAGGGLYIDQDSIRENNVEVDTSTISGNSATDGAGVDISEDSDGRITINTSTISGNTGGPSSFGGGLLIQGEVYNTFELSDSTISGNTATTGGGVSLGGISADEPLTGTDDGYVGSIDLDNSTIAGNSATANGGGIYLGTYAAGSPAVAKSGTVDLASTIVAGNAANGVAQDLFRPTNSTDGGFDADFSLIQMPGLAPLSGASVIVGESPELGALANNGGPTDTMLPSGLSPVIDQGHAPSSLTTDQRGDPRTVQAAIPDPPGGDGTDIGSVELPVSSVVVPTPTPTPTVGFGVLIRTTPLGGATTPLLVGDSTPVTCSVQSGTIASCVVEVRYKGILEASGEVTATGSTNTLTAEVTPTTAGSKLLAKNPLGITAGASAVASATGSPTVSGAVHLLARPSITLPLGTRSAKLSKGVLKDLDQVAKLITGAKTVTCTAYSDKGKHDDSVTYSQAKAACARLVKDGLKGKIRIVGKGHASPVASNKSKKGRAANRRVVVAFTF
jgi:hypothetical protein